MRSEVAPCHTRMGDACFFMLRCSSLCLAGRQFKAPVKQDKDLGAHEVSFLLDWHGYFNAVSSVLSLLRRSGF